MKIEYIFIAFMFGVGVGGAVSAIIWDNKCSEYEKEITKINKHLEKEYARW